MTWVLISVGGAVGTACRYGLSLWAGRVLGAAFPYGTLLANVLGSFLLAVVMQLGSGREVLGTDARLILGVGVMGGFTTYSSFNLEVIKLAEGGMIGRAAGYMAGTMVLCLLSGAVGWYSALAFRGA